MRMTISGWLHRPVPLTGAERVRTGIGDEHGFGVYYYGTGTLNQ